jgi:hypothetical protein
MMSISEELCLTITERLKAEKHFSTKEYESICLPHQECFNAFCVMDYSEQ